MTLNMLPNADRSGDSSLCHIRHSKTTFKDFFNMFYLYFRQILFIFTYISGN